MPPAISNTNHQFALATIGRLAMFHAPFDVIRLPFEPKS